MSARDDEQLAKGKKGRKKKGKGGGTGAAGPSQEPDEQATAEAAADAAEQGQSDLDEDELELIRLREVSSLASDKCVAENSLRDCSLTIILKSYANMQPRDDTVPMRFSSSVFSS